MRLRRVRSGRVRLRPVTERRDVIPRIMAGERGVRVEPGRRHKMAAGGRRPRAAWAPRPLARRAVLAGGCAPAPPSSAKLSLAAATPRDAADMAANMYRVGGERPAAPAPPPSPAPPARVVTPPPPIRRGRSTRVDRRAGGPPATP